MTAAPHLLAGWDAQPASRTNEGIAFVIFPATTSEPLAEVLARDGAEEIAQLMASAPALRDALRELMEFCRPVCVINKLDGGQIVHPAFAQAQEALAAATAVVAIGEGAAYV